MRGGDCHGGVRGIYYIFLLVFGYSEIFENFKVSFIRVACVASIFRTAYLANAEINNEPTLIKFKFSIIKFKSIFNNLKSINYLKIYLIYFTVLYKD